MSPFFDDLESQLRSAARSRAGAPAGARDVRRWRRPRRGWLRAGLRAVPVLTAVLITLAVGGAALVLLGHRGHGGSSGSPPPGGRLGAIIAHTPKKQLRREFAYVVPVLNAGNRKACRLQQPAGVTYIHGSPGSDLLSRLGVLRRRATPADRLTPSALGALTGTPDIYRAYVRRAFSAGGVSYYIVPTRYDRAASVPSDRCFELQVAALDRELPRIPTSLRQPTRKLLAAIIADQRRIGTRTPRDSICLVDVARNESGTACGISASAIEQGVATQTFETNRGAYSGVVPDEVATVTLVFPAGKGQPTRSLTIPVRSNVYVMRGNTPSRPPTVIWRSTDGRVLKRISPPTAAAQARLCEQIPMCLLTQTAITSSSGSGSGSVSATRTR